MLLKLEGLLYVSSLDLNIGYYHIKLHPGARHLWYNYNTLHLGLCNSLDVFQEKMNELFPGFNYIIVYIDNLLIISKTMYDDHLDKIDSVLYKLGETGLKVNAATSFFDHIRIRVPRLLDNPWRNPACTNKNNRYTKHSATYNNNKLLSFIGMIN